MKTKFAAIVVGVVLSCLFGLGRDGAGSPVFATETDHTHASMPVPVQSLSTWKISCGYGCAEHDNVGTPDLFAIDIKKSGGAVTAGQPVIAPWMGIVSAASWTEVQCGGKTRDYYAPNSHGIYVDEISGDKTHGYRFTGYRVGLFHIDVSVAAGATIYREDTVLGKIQDTSALSADCPHLHIQMTYLPNCAGKPTTTYANCNGMTSGQTAKELILAGRKYANCPSPVCWGSTHWSECSAAQDGNYNAQCQHHLRNNSLWNTDSVGNHIGGTRVETQDANLSPDPVGDNKADYVIVNAGCRMQLFDQANYGGLVAVTSSGYAGGLKTVLFQGTTTSVIDRASSAKILCP